VQLGLTVPPERAPDPRCIHRATGGDALGGAIVRAIEFPERPGGSRARQAGAFAPRIAGPAEDRASESTDS